MSRKKLSIKLKYTKKTLTLVKVLTKIGYISNYAIITTKENSHIIQQPTSHNTFIYINTLFFKNTTFFKTLRLVSTPSKKHTISLQALRVVNTSIKSSLLILSTPHGIIDHKEALRLRTGGIILCIAS
jgi:ribosomal protein S8